jgi:hypothetical protein
MGDAILSTITIIPMLADRMKEAQERDHELRELREKASCGEALGFNFASDGILRTSDFRAVVPNGTKLKEEILSEAHKTQYTVHLRSTKMYQDLKRNYLWPSMKHNIAEYVARCSSCQLVKAEHQRPAGPLQSLDIPMWKWDQIAMDFVVG